jgi:hypothetical protein
VSPKPKVERATFCPQADEVDPCHFADYVLNDPKATSKLPELATAFHPRNHPQVEATLEWASREGQAILVGQIDGDFDVMNAQVHLNLDAPMLCERFAPYGHLHLMLHDLTHHYLGQIRVRPQDVTPERINETRKRIHQAAMLGELVASFATVSRIIPGYSNYCSHTQGRGRSEQFGGFFSFSRSEREVIDGWKALYSGGDVFRDYLRRELDPEVVLDYRRAGDWLVWPSLACVLGERRWPAWLKRLLSDPLARLEARLAPHLLPRVFPWAYWSHSVYSVADFQKDCRHLADRYTSVWHMDWQRDFDDGHSFDEVVARCHGALRGLVSRDYDFFLDAPGSIDGQGAPRGYEVNVRRQQVRLFARKTYELAARIAADDGFYTGPERRAWLTELERAHATLRELFATLRGRDAATRYEREFLPLRAHLAQRFEAEFEHFAVDAERRDVLTNPTRALVDPGVRDANSQVKSRKSLAARWKDLKAFVAKLVGRKVDSEQREWVLEIYAGLDHHAMFDAAEAAGIPTVGREQPPPPQCLTPPVRSLPSGMGPVPLSPRAA